MATGDGNGGDSGRRRRTLSDDELDYIVERVIAIAGDRIAEVATKKTVDQLYIAVGKGVLRRISYFLGAALLAIIVFMVKQGVNLK